MFMLAKGEVELNMKD